MQDLSHLLPGDPVTALAPTSQSGGNMMSDSKLAMTAPGSQPVDPLPPTQQQADPKVTPSNPAEIKTGTDGKPQASKQAGAPGFPPPSWKPTTIPAVVREN